MKSFETYHPIVLFVYFVSVIGITMFFMHPIYVSLSFFAAVLMNSILFGVHFWKRSWVYVLLFLGMAIINPLISHNGEMVLFYVNHNAVTVEAIAYGMVIALMLLAVLLWFKVYNDTMTSDKFIYLFGRIVPVFALVISITLRLVPLFKRQIKQITQAQKTIGMDYAVGNLWHRIKSIVHIFSILLTWALENTIETADAMKARGYGLPKRTTFSLFRFELRDTIVLSFIGILTVGTVVGSFIGNTTFYFYPTFSTIEFNWYNVWFYIIYTMLLLLPIVIELKERWQWRSLQSKI